MTSGRTAEERELLAEFRARARRSPWLAYPITSVPAIRPWHESTSTYRVLSGPNGGGKTTAGAAELVSYATGFNPIRKEAYQVPNVTWGVCVEYKSAGRVMLRKLSEMLPRRKDGSRNWRYYKSDNLIVLGMPNGKEDWSGSEIAIKSQKEGESSLLGERCTAIWVDEAMGGDAGQENFGELQARGLPDQPLYMFFTLTPKVDIDLGWMQRKLWQEPGRAVHEEFIQGTFCHRFTLKDCLLENGGYVSRPVYEAKLREVPEEEKAARIDGMWSPFAIRHAFSWKFLEQCMARALEQKPVRFRDAGYRRYVLEETDGGPCRMQRERESGHNYIAAWDPASGLGKGHDASALVVFDRGDLTQVFHARSNTIGPEQFAREIALPASRYYNDALLIVENNGEGGGSSVAAVRDSGANLYYQTSVLRMRAENPDRIGWITTEQSRYRMVDALLRCLEEDKWTPSRDLIEEMSHIMKKPQPSGRYRVEHADGYHDDLVMAAGMALAVHFEEPIDEWVDFSKLRIRYGPMRTLQELPLA